MRVALQGLIFLTVFFGFLAYRGAATARRQELGNLLGRMQGEQDRTGQRRVPGAAALRRLLHRVLVRLGPAGRALQSEEMARQLLWAGVGMDPEQFAAVKLLCAAGGAVLGLLCGSLCGGLTGAGPGAALGGGGGYLLPERWLGGRMAARRAQIEREVLLYADFLATVLTVDQTVDQALLRVHQELGGVVAAAFARSARAQSHVGQLGQVALEEVAERLNHPDVSAIVAVLAGSKRYGASIAEALHELAESLRSQRRERVRERAGRLGTLLVLPISVFLLPSLLLLIGFPALTVMRNIGHI